PSHAAQPSRTAQPGRAAPPSRTALLSRTALPSRTALHCLTASASTTATLATAPTAAMASPTVLTFDTEGRAVDFDVWVDDLQLFLQCDSRDGVSFFDHTSSVSTAPAATADSMVRSQWTTCDAVACLAVRSHLQPAERAHFGQYKTAQSLYDAIGARYSSPATAALSHLMLLYLFPDLAAFTTVADLVAHLRTSDARYRAALPTKGVPLSPFSLLLLLLLLSTSLALRRSELRLPLVGDAATARARGARVVEGAAREAVEEVEEADEVAVEVGVVPGVGASVAAVEVVAVVVEVVEAAAVVVEVAAAVVLVEVQPRSVEALVVASASSSCAPVRPRRSGSFVSGTLGVGGLGVLVPALKFFAPAGAGDLLRQNVNIFDLDFDAILAAMYAVIESAEGDCYLCVLPDPGIEAAALGASASAAPGTSDSAVPSAGESALFGTAPTEPLHTFTLDSGALRSLFRDSTTHTPLSRPVAVSLADPSRGPVLAHSSMVLPCPAAPSGLLSRLHLPSFSTNLVSGADLQDAWVAASSQVFAAASRSSPASAPFIVSSSVARDSPLAPPPWSPLPASSSSQRAAPHSSSFPPTEAPLQTLHMDVWGPAHVRGQGHERYFLLVVDDYSRYTTVFPLHSKDEVPEVLIDWIRGARRQLSESFGSDLPILRLHSDRGGEFPSDLLRAFCRSEGICHTFTLPASPQQNGIAERRIGMVMDVARTSMIHAAAPHFLWPFAVQYTAHQINLQPHVSLPKTTLTLRWTGKVGDASAFRIWGSRAFVRDTSADKLSSRAVPCVFLGFPPNAPGWQFYHPTSRRVLSSQDVTFDESVSYYRLFPYRTASPPPPLLFLAPGTPPTLPSRSR
ncbi:unnamed protein product, partial [Closterium sp. NIES-53]